MSAKVPVNCPTCSETLIVTHEQLRAAADEGRPVPCIWCAVTKATGKKATSQPHLTAAEVLLLAAAELHSTRQMHGDPTEFSEWDLSVAAWQHDPKRFGLRGYADRHPDHKRVSMEIMGQKPSSPVVQKLMEKVRPNTYRLTPAGMERAKVLGKMRKGAKK